MSKGKVIPILSIIANAILILNTVFYKITFRSEIFGSCLATGIPFAISLLLLLFLRGKKLAEKEKNLLILSYGIAYIIFFRYIVVLLLLI